MIRVMGALECQPAYILSCVHLFHGKILFPPKIGSDAQEKKPFPRMDHGLDFHSWPHSDASNSRSMPLISSIVTW